MKPMRGAGALAAVTVLALALGAMTCGKESRVRQPPGPEPQTVEQAYADLTSFVDAMAGAIAGGAPLRREPEDPPGAQCQDSIGRFTGKYNLGYAAVFDVRPDEDVGALLDKARSHLDDRGWRVSESGIGGREPTLRGDDGRLTVALRIIAHRNRAELSGSTPCLPSEHPEK